MTIAEKILKAKTYYDAVYEAGKNSVNSNLEYVAAEYNAHELTIPEGMGTVCKINKIGGMTYKTRNLIPFPTKEYSANGVTFTPQEDGSILVNGTATDYTAYELIKQGGAKGFSLSKDKTYTLSGCPSGGAYETFGLRIQDLTYYQTFADYGNGDTRVASYTDYYCFILIKEGTTVNNLVFKPMLNEGSTALPYEPYFEGLRSAEVSDLTTEYGNLFNYYNIIDAAKGTNEKKGKVWVNSTAWNYNLYTGQAGSSATVPEEYWHKLPYLKKGTYYLYFDIDFLGVDVAEADRTMQARSIINGQDIWCGQEGQSIVSGGPFRMTADGYCYLRRVYNKKCVISNIMITKEPRTSYVPYGRDTVKIPEAIKSLDGYGLGKNADEYNYIDFGNKIFNQDYAKVRLPSDSGSYVQSMNWYAMNLSSLGLSPITRNVVCNILPSNDVQEKLDADGIYINSSKSHIVIRKSEFTTQAEYRQWLADNEVYIIERLAEPIETDISEYLTDEYLQIEEGRSLVVNNEFNLEAPIQLTYITNTPIDFATGNNVGKELQYDEFWNNYQDCGERTDYRDAFIRWDDRTFNPKYDIKPIGLSQNMFRYANITNLEEKLKKNGVTLDTSKATSLNCAFGEMLTCEVLPEISLEGTANVVSYATGVFNGNKAMHTLRKLIVNENVIPNSLFGSCPALENLTIEGKIGQNGFSTSSCTKLSKASWYSIIEALSPNTSGLVFTGSLVSVQTAFETSPGQNDGDASSEWNELVNSKPNWTIELV